MSTKAQCLLLTLLTLPGTALAGGTAVLQSGDSPSDAIEIAWQDSDTLRMQAPGDQSYFIVRDGKAYSVSMNDGQPMVIDMGAMMQMMRGMAGAADRQQPEFMRPSSFEATGESETVAGIEGRVYRISWTDDNGREQTREAVLTDDPTVVEMTEAYMNSISSMFGAGNASGFQAAMPDGRRGLLRVGDDFKLASIDDADPPAAAFELPAEPTDLGAMMRGGR